MSFVKVKLDKGILILKILDGSFSMARYGIISIKFPYIDGIAHLLYFVSRCQAMDYLSFNVLLSFAAVF